MMMYSTILSNSAVAPHVGAWIEIRRLLALQREQRVAPHVGAWIEISISITSFQFFLVAPHVGAWINPTKTTPSVCNEAFWRCF